MHGFSSKDAGTDWWLVTCSELDAPMPRAAEPTPSLCVLCRPPPFAIVVSWRGRLAQPF